MHQPEARKDRKGKEEEKSDKAEKGEDGEEGEKEGGGEDNSLVDDKRLFVMNLSY